MQLRLNGELRNGFNYDDLGQLQSMTSYDLGRGSLLGTAAEKAMTHTYTFNWESGQIESMTSSDGQYQQFDYDNRDRLQTKVADGKTTRYKYHGNGDLKEVKVDGEVARKFEYTTDGQIYKLSDAGVEATFEYDSIGRLKKLNVPGEEPFEYQYDVRGLSLIHI